MLSQPLGAVLNICGCASGSSSMFAWIWRCLLLAISCCMSCTFGSTHQQGTRANHQMPWQHLHHCDASSNQPALAHALSFSLLGE